MQSSRLACAWIVVASVIGCGNGDDSRSSPRPVACDAERVTQCPDDTLTYADVQPIFEKTCSSAACHSGFVGGPWPLDSYSHIADWQDVVRDELLTCAMPPPDSGIGLAHDERQLILAWIRCGYPE